MTFQEGTWAAWLYDVLKPHVTEVLCAIHVIFRPRNLHKSWVSGLNEGSELEANSQNDSRIRPPNIENVSRKVHLLVGDPCEKPSLHIKRRLVGPNHLRPDYIKKRRTRGNQAAIGLAAQLHPDLILLDIGMPVLKDCDAADQIRCVSPRSKIVFLTQENDTDIRDAALATGASGFLLKANAESKLLSTIAIVPRNGRRTH